MVSQRAPTKVIGTHTRIGQRVDMLEGPESGIPSPTALPVLIRYAGDTDTLLVIANERRRGVEQVECVAELNILMKCECGVSTSHVPDTLKNRTNLRANFLAEVERRTYFFHFLLSSQRP